MRRSTIGLLIGVFAIVLLAQGPYWWTAKDWSDGSELKAFSQSIGIAAIGGIVAIVREYLKYQQQKRYRPAELQRKTTKICGIPIVDDSEGQS